MLTKLETRVLLLALTTQRDVEEAINKKDLDLYDERYIKDLNSLIDKFEAYYKENFNV